MNAKIAYLYNIFDSVNTNFAKLLLKDKSKRRRKSLSTSFASIALLQSLDYRATSVSIASLPR